MPAKKAVPSGPVQPKQHFFTPRSQVPPAVEQVVVKPVVVVPPPKPRFEPRPRLLFNADTDVAYAEIIDGVAICLETGQEMFEVHGRQEEEVAVVHQSRRLDFSPPTARYPGELVSQDLIDAGVLTENDFRDGSPSLTSAQFFALRTANA